nr:ammonium transporter Rh type A [Onthophagus taurus]
MTIPTHAIQGVMGSKLKDIYMVLSFQLILLVLFGFFVRYETNEHHYELQVYPMFQDVHVMIFIGFGYLMTFLKRYGFSAVGFNFLLAAVIVQWALVCKGFYNLTSDYKILINVGSLLKADVASATVLISMGALLGNTSYLQLIIMGIIEIAVFTGNSYLGSNVFKAVDAGDSIFVHAFGAYFGLAVSFILCRKKDIEEESSLEGSSYNSDIFAMIGTVFLWMFWPSFNSAELEGDQKLRGIVNTYLALTSCCVTAYALSAAMTPNRKFDMVHIQNSTLAGGVAIGTSANLLIQPYGAIIVGIVAGALSVFGYSVLTPSINRTLRVHDTCGVHNLHGMPGVLAGLVGALMAGIASTDRYGPQVYELFPARAPTNTSSLTDNIEARTASVQAGYQILAVVVTVIIAIVSGLITGLILDVVAHFPTKNAYADDPCWLIHEPHSDSKSVKTQPADEIHSINDSPMELDVSKLPQ